MKEKIFEKITSEKIVYVTDKNIGLKGYLVIDKSIDNTSRGGLRMTSDVNLLEVQELAKGMTYKHAFIGFNSGGAKAGIIASESLSRKNKEKLLKRFGEKISELLITRKYRSGSDIGTDAELITIMNEHVGLTIPNQTKYGKKSGYYTSLAVESGIMESTNMKRMSFKKSTYAIEGFGAVGSNLALNLYKKGIKVLAISNKYGALYNTNGLNIEEIKLFIEKNGEKNIHKYTNAKNIAKEKLLELNVDVLCPCGTGKTINSKNMKSIKAKIICAGANGPVTMKAENYLFNKGVLYLPDFATNCGGILGNSVEHVGLGEKELWILLREYIAPKLRLIYTISQKNKIPPRLITINIIDKILEKKKNEENIHSKIHKIGSALFRYRVIPNFLIKKYAFDRFKKNINKDLVYYK